MCRHAVFCNASCVVAPDIAAMCVVLTTAASPAVWRGERVIACRMHCGSLHMCTRRRISTGVCVRVSVCVLCMSALRCDVCVWECSCVSACVAGHMSVCACVLCVSVWLCVCACFVSVRMCVPCMWPGNNLACASVPTVGTSGVRPTECYNVYIGVCPSVASSSEATVRISTQGDTSVS